jgi:hypothetical protein
MNGVSKMVKISVAIIGFLAVIIFGFMTTRDQDPNVQTRARRANQTASGAVLNTGDDLQGAINRAKKGETITLQAGATFKGPIVLPDKGPGWTDTDYITIRTSDLAGISKEGDRVQPKVHAASMPKIVSAGGNEALGTAPGAHHFRFIGIEFSPTASASYIYNLINLGTADHTSLSQLPHHLVFDRCFVRSTGLNKVRRGFGLNSAETSILNSHISGFAGAGDETQAIGGWNGTGPFKIVNNYVEGAAENILIGGADPSIQGLVPSDIEIRRNFFSKPAEWAGRATLKASIELKNARRVTIDGNVIDTSIRLTAIVLTVRNQDGKAPWSTLEDITVTNNIVKRASTGVNILGTDERFPSQMAKRIKVENNLFVDIGMPGELTYFLQTNGAELVTVSHNTVQHTGNIITAYGQSTSGFSFTNNIVQYNSYGISCQVQGPGCSDSPFCKCFPRALIKGNIVANNANVDSSIQNVFTLGNFIVRSFDEIGFAGYRDGNWQLSPTSKIKKRATDGKDPGVDFQLLQAAGANSAIQGFLQ